MAVESLSRLARATVVSLIGLRDVYRSEPAFRQELLVLFLVIPTAWLLTSTGVERTLLIGSWMLVLVVVNSAIEAAIGLPQNVMSFRGKQKISALWRFFARLCFRWRFGCWSCFPLKLRSKG